MSATETHPFDIFWAAYPRRVNKIAARDAFRWALQNHNQDGQLLALILKTIAWQKEEQPDPKHWVYPDKWLLKERWTDEPIAEVVVPSARERADYRQWCFSLGPSAKGVSIHDWVRRQRRVS